MVEPLSKFWKVIILQAAVNYMSYKQFHLAITFQYKRRDLREKSTNRLFCNQNTKN